ncbi:MAG TPA: efflux RND transporter periplasmic adaptor subunit [Woeseiaceae bacterium]
MNRHLLRLAGTTLCALLAAACTEDRGAQPAPVPSAEREVRVIVQPLEFNTERTRVEAVGTSRALLSIAVHPAVSGEVVSVNFEPGQKVEQGDVLVELDSRDEKLAVQLAKVRLEDAERLYERYRRTGDSGAVLPTALDAARTAVDAARIELDRARVALDYRTIEAPFSGYVGITDVDPGDRVNPDTLITTLDDRSSLLVSFEVPEALSGRLTTQNDVQIATWNSREPAGFGEVVNIDSRIDPVTRTFLARALVQNGDDRLRPGMSFRVTVDVPGIPYPVVPETGVQWGADGAFVWSVTDNRAHRVPVAIVQRQQGEILVDSAQLEEGDLIVVEGIQRVRDGIEVVFDRPALVDRSLDGGAATTPVGTD